MMAKLEDVQYLYLTMILMEMAELKKEVQEPTERHMQVMPPLPPLILSLVNFAIDTDILVLDLYTQALIVGVRI